jgi:hypothetical protein
MSGSSPERVRTISRARINASSIEPEGSGEGTRTSWQDSDDRSVRPRQYSDDWRSVRLRQYHDARDTRLAAGSPSLLLTITALMGRPTWLTPEQLAFLQSFVPTLDDEKKHNGLIPCYDRISVEFIKKWVSPFTETAQDRATADAARTLVSSLAPSAIQPLMLL